MTLRGSCCNKVHGLSPVNMYSRAFRLPVDDEVGKERAIILESLAEIQPTEVWESQDKVKSTAVLVNDNLADKEVGRLRTSLPTRWVSRSTSRSRTK